MLLTSLIILISIAITLLQFLSPSRFGWNTARVLSLLLAGLSICNAYLVSKDRDFYSGTLEKIGTRINWQGTDAIVELLNDAESVSPDSVSVQVKIFTPSELHKALKKGIDEKSIQRSCVIDPRWGLGYMPDKTAEMLFHAFEKPVGIINTNAEREAGVESLIFSGRELFTTPLGNAKVRVQLQNLLNTRSHFTSLVELNGAMIVAYLSASNTSSLIFSSTSLKLSSAAGNHRIDFPVTFTHQNTLRPLDGGRFIGVCVPKDYFFVNSHQS